MNRISFYLPAGLLTLMLAAKFLFFSMELSYSMGFLSNVNLVLIVSLFIYALISYFSSKVSSMQTREKHNFVIVTCLLLAICAVFSFSFYTTIIKAAPDWDAVALYDARAHFLQAGYKFSDMLKLSEYDSKNSYYYLLYPPFTSLLHWMSYSIGISNVTLLYPIQLVLLTIGIFALTYRRLGIIFSLLVCLLSIGQEHIFLTATIAYTNMPYTLYLTLGILLLYEYIIENNPWQFIMGMLLVVTSQWIRFLEPNWASVLLAFTIVSFRLPKSTKQKALLLGSFIVLALSEYLSWNNFVLTARSNESIFSFSLLNFVEPVVGIFTGSFIHILIIYTTMWENSIFAVLASLLPLNTKTTKPLESEANLFLRIVILGSFVLYLGGLYFISFQVSWWQEMGGSLVRSTTFLLPLTLYLVLYQLKQFISISQKQNHV